MNGWNINFEQLIKWIDGCIKSHDDEALVLKRLAENSGYSEYYFSRKFREISGMTLKDFLRYRRLAFSLEQLRDTDRNILDIALDYGFSSHEAFTRAFSEAYGITPAEYRRRPVPVALRTVLKPFDCYLAESGECSEAVENVKTYFVTIPKHKFLHIRNYESIGYYDFWQKQNRIKGQDFDTVCRLLDSIKGKLDDGSGQIMAYLNDPAGRICTWGIPLAECYGVRLPADYDGEIPPNMIMTEIPEGEYIVFEHGPFDYETENSLVEERIEKAMKAFDYEASGCCLDMAAGRIFYFYHDCKRYWKYIRPICRT